MNEQPTGNSADPKSLSVKARPIRKGFVWLAKPTIWRNRWNLDEAVAPSAPSGMGVKELTNSYKRIKSATEDERLLNDQVLEKIESMSDSEAYQYYVQVEELSDAYMEHRRQSLRIKGWVSYLIAFVTLIMAFQIGSEFNLATLVGRVFMLLLIFVFFGQGVVSFYRAEQIRQRRMFNLFDMFETPHRFIF